MFHISTLYFLAGILGAILIFLILTKNTSKNTVPFIILVLVASYYSILYGIELLMQTPDLILSAIRFEYIGVAIIPPLWLISVISYIRRENILKPAILAVLFAIPLIVVLTAHSRFMIPLLYQSVNFFSSGDLLLISVVPGLVYMLNFTYFVIAFISGILILADFSRHTEGIINRQVKIFILGGIILLITYLLQVYWVSPTYHIDITPLAYLFTLLMAFVGLFHYRLFSLVPVAYDSIFNRIPTGLIIVDNQGYVIEANNIAEKTLSCSIKKNAGKQLTEYCPAWPEFNEFVHKVVNNGLKEEKTELFCIKGDKYTIYGLQTTFLKDRHGNIEGAIFTIRDITREKNAEREIKDSEKRFRELFEESPVAYAALNEKGNLIEVNHEFTRMTGYTESEALNKHFSEFVPDSAKEEVFDAYRQFLKIGTINFDLEIESKDKRLLTIFLTARTQYDLNGKHIITHAVLHDVTERKMMEKALSQANKKLNLLSSITRHDILNQITILQAYLELTREHLKKSEDSNPQLVSYTEKESAATANIYEQIKFTEDYQDIGIKTPVWQKVKDTFENSIKGINLGSVTTTADVGDIEIYADPLLEKVFYNLVENSMKYGENLTQIRIYIEKNDTGIILKYTDNGTGIPADEKENIFLRKYFRHSGFGMFLSREILAITGITIKETGVPGEGAVFEIFVPNGMYKFE